MLMADTMAIFLVILGLMLALPGLWLLCRGLWPNTVTHATVRCRKGLWASFLVGAPLTAIVVVASAVFFNVLGPVGKMMAAGVICLYLIYAHMGTAGLATAIGQRLSSPIDEARPWRATLRGGVVLELTYLIPILGWFIILPSSIIVGCGAATIALVSQIKERLSTRPDVAHVDSESAVGVGVPAGAAR